MGYARDKRVPREDTGLKILKLRRALGHSAGSPIFVNLDTVVAFEGVVISGGEPACVLHITEDEGQIYVRETPEEIIGMLDAMKRAGVEAWGAGI